MTLVLRHMTNLSVHRFYNFRRTSHVADASHFHMLAFACFEKKRVFRNRITFFT